MLKVAEFCAGTGAFSLALQKCGPFETVFANDIDEKCKVTFDLNHDTRMVVKDIHDLKNEDIPSMDVMTFGFPCQPFSLAGKKQGFKDKRSNVFWRICEIIDHHHPRVIFAENVKNLLGHDSGKTFQSICDRFKELGYHVKHKVMNTSVYTGIPQNRERLFIVGFKNIIEHDAFQFPSEAIRPHPVSNYLLDEVADKYYYSASSKIWPLLSQGVKEVGKVYQYRRVYVRENKNDVCPTLTANMGAGGHNVPVIKDNNGIRKLTPRECFRLQGFPENYVLPLNLSDTALYKQAGNAVTVRMIELIGKNIYSALSTTTSDLANLS